MLDAEARFSIEELALRAGVPVRTIRYYVSEGLLPGPSGRGRQAEYTSDHLARLLLIRRLVKQRVPLAEQRAYLAGVGDDEVRALLGEQERQEQELRLAELGPSPREYVAALLGRAQSARGAAPVSSAATAGSAPPSAPELHGDAWRRVRLAPGVELHIRSDATRREQGLIEEIITLARSYKHRGRR